MSRRRNPQSRRSQPRKPAPQQAAPQQAPGAQQPAKERRRPAAQPPTRRRQLWPLWPPSGAALGLITVAVVGAAVALALALHGSSNAAGPAPFGTPLGSPTTTPPVLAPISTTVTGQPIDGIQCSGTEQLVFHIHAHLAIYVNGSARTVPEGIGIMPPRQETPNAAGVPTVISGSCFYWLHAHTPDGIIHVESPVQRTYTLGNWFDIWGIPLDATHVGPASGTVIAYLNGQLYSGDIRSIPLDAHNLIQLDVNGNVAPAPFTFAPGL